ncbi:MAG TPA: metallophosphoesterase [Candidatus Omnitrophota bacterium]|nr:metallophosphoesterase [Candidatus Omnitrophota bacterium]
MTKFSLLKYTLLGISILSVSAAAWILVWRRRFGKTGKFSALIAAVIVLFFFDIYILEPNWIREEHVRIEDAGLAERLEGIKVIHITDLHVKHEIGFLEKELIRKINALEPDLILMTGDYADSSAYLPQVEKLLGQLRARIGIIGVAGNTGNGPRGPQELQRRFAPLQVQMLLNESVRVELPSGKYIWIAGVNDPVYHSDNLDAAMRPVPPGEPVILLAHGPQILDKAVVYGIPLVLVGHTHGGQVGIPALVKLSKYANRTIYMKGLFRKGATQMYVNRGIGTHTLPIRFLCRPEIAILEFF